MDRPTDAVGIEIHDVYAHFGHAMFAAQCVERQLVVLAPMLLGLRPKLTTQPELAAIWDRMFAQSMGRTLRDLERESRLPPGFEDRLNEALQLRNWLAHNYFWERAGEFLSEAGRAKMRRELAETAELLHALDDELVQIGDEWRRSVGASDDLVADKMQQLISDAPAVHEPASPTESSELSTQLSQLLAR